MDRRISLLRVLACFLVVLLHVSAVNFHVPAANFPALLDRFWVATTYGSLSRVCVPIFFMIAGATLLHASEPLAAFLRKRMLRILPPLILWSVFYLWWLHHNGLRTDNWFLAILAGPTMYHLWYFYAAIGLYAVVPILRRFMQNCSNAELGWFLGVWFFVASLFPTAYALLYQQNCRGPLLGPLGGVYHLTYFGGYVGYLVLGAALRQRAASLGGWRTGLPVFLVASAATTLLTWADSRAVGAPCEFFNTYLQPLVILASAGFFVAVAGSGGGEPSPWLQRLSDATVGIYGLHVLMIDRVAFHTGLSAATGNAWVTSLLASLVVFGACFLVIDTLRRLRPLRFTV